MIASISPASISRERIFGVSRVHKRDAIECDGGVVPVSFRAFELDAIAFRC